MNTLRLVVISGLSGAGKSIALHTLEDIGFYCTDNLPVTLLPDYAEQLVHGKTHLYDMVAVGVDARNPADVLERFPEIRDELAAKGVKSELMFLDADDSVLVKRFNETRRKHPLSDHDRVLDEAIIEERARLEPLAELADILINTSTTNVHQLREIVRHKIGSKSSRFSLLIQSFGFKHGQPADADFIFDVRCLPNPHWDPTLRHLTGQDKAVSDFLSSKEDVDSMLLDICSYLENWLPKFQQENRSYLTVALGCTGGQHRSVYLAEALGKHFKGQYGDDVVIRHRELNQN